MELNDFLSSLDKNLVNYEENSKTLIEVLSNAKKHNISLDSIIESFNENCNNETIQKNLLHIINNALRLDIENQYQVFIISTLTIVYNSFYNLLFNDFHNENEDSLIELEKLTGNVNSSLKLHIKNIKEIESKIDSYKNEQQEKAEALIERVKEQLKHQEKKINDLIPQAVSILGIFITIIVVLLGSLSIIDSFTILERISEESISLFIFVVTFTGQVLFNTLFLQLVLIAKISGRHIHNVCSNFLLNEKFVASEEVDKRLAIFKHHCYYCVNKNKKSKCGFVRKKARRFPYIYALNIFCILVYISLGIWYFFIR